MLKNILNSYRAYELEFASKALDEEFSKLTRKEKEWTSTPANRRFRELFAEALKKNSDLSIKKSYDRYDVVQYLVRYKDGFRFRVTVDPGVIEIILDKFKVATFKKNIRRLERDVYSVARNLGLYPEKKGPSMHLSLDIQTTFGSDVLFFHNFLIDVLNHKPIWTKILGRADDCNAPFVDDLSKKQQKNFLLIQDDFLKGKIVTISEYARRLLDEVFYKSNWGNLLHHEDKPQKYMIFNLLDFMNPKLAPRLEFRGLKTPTNAHTLSLVDELLSQRLIYLKRQKEPFQYKPLKMSSTRCFEHWLMQMKVSKKRFASLYN